MKKFIYILVMLLIISFVPNSAFADNNLIISNWTVDSILLENGDLSIVEDITFKFNDKFNGVFRDIVLEGTGGIKDFSLYEIVSGQEIEYKLSSDPKKGDTNVYILIDENDGKTVQIFSPSEDESKTFRLKYTVVNVATRHNDIGELYYKFIGEENNTLIDHFSANINLPKFEKDKIKIFGHGPLNGEINFSDDNLIKLEIDNISTNKFIEARILFPLDYIPTSTNIGYDNFNNIMKEENAYSEKLSKDMARKEKEKDIFNTLSIFFSTLTIGVMGFFFNKFRRNPEIFQEMNSLYPESISPAEVSIFMNQGINTRTLLATLFDLSNKGYITMEELEVEIEDKSKGKFKIHKEKNREFLFKKTSSPMVDLLDHELFLMDWLFSIGGGKEVSTLDIENYRTKYITQFIKAQNKWIKKVQGNLESRNYFDPNGKKSAGYILIINFFILILGIFSIINEAFYGVILILLSIVLFIYALSLYTRKSDKGHIQYLLWKDFKSNISSLDRKQADISKDKILIYAIALGIPMKDINNYRENIGSDYYPMHWGYWYFLMNRNGGSLLEDKMTQSFYGTYGTSSSTSSGFGGGGGFTGGGGGGAGGGGAGGF